MIATADARSGSILDWMEILSDPTRLRLLRLLERDELGVAEICDVLQLPQSTVSRHLKVLLDRRWLRSRAQGTNRLYCAGVQEMGAAATRLWALAREQSDAWATARQDSLRLNRLLRERESGSQTFFAGAASEWDKLRDELYGSGFGIESLLALLPRQWVVADLGCGTGRLASELSPHVTRIIGVDNSTEMLRAARRRVSDLGNVELRRGNLEAIPISDASCDAALLVLALTYVQDPGNVLREAHRILKPGGRMVVVDLLPHDREDFRRRMEQYCRGMDLAQVRQMLGRAGFEHVIGRPLPAERGVKGPGLFLAAGSRSTASVSNN